VLADLPSASKGPRINPNANSPRGIIALAWVMVDQNFILKLVLGPLIIATATMVSRRWGEHVGGLMVGLPLTSAPVSIFFAVEQGKSFAYLAAKGSLLGMIPVAVFCLGYLVACRHYQWYIASIFSIACYSTAVWGLSFINLTLLQTTIVVPVALAIAMWLLGQPKKKAVPIASPLWDLPLRMFVAAFMIVMLTSLAGILGPKWSGLLTPFPVFTLTLAIFSHLQGGPDSAWRFLRGLVTGLFGYTAFFLVVALLVERADLALVYFLASVAALLVNGFSLLRLASKKGELTAGSNI
jgi:hypothetical protein